MKTLHLMRHAKSGWDSPVERDFDRPLNERGRKGASAIGQWVKRQGLAVDHIIASPAVRVADTLDVFRPTAGIAVEPHWDRRIYLASAATLFDLVHELPDSADACLMAGHNPGLEDLIFLLVADRDEDQNRTEVEEKFPTAAFATLTFAVDRWADIQPETAQFLHFVRPRDLDPTLGPASAD